MGIDMIPAHKYRNREFMPHEFQMVHNAMAFAIAIVNNVTAEVVKTPIFEQELNHLKQAMKILESKR